MGECPYIFLHYHMLLAYMAKYSQQWLHPSIFLTIIDRRKLSGIITVVIVLLYMIFGSRWMGKCSSVRSNALTAKTKPNFMTLGLRSVVHFSSVFKKNIYFLFPCVLKFFCNLFILPCLSIFHCGFVKHLLGVQHIWICEICMVLDCDKMNWFFSE